MQVLKMKQCQERQWAPIKWPIFMSILKRVYLWMGVTYVPVGFGSRTNESASIKQYPLTSVIFILVQLTSKLNVFGKIKNQSGQCKWYHQIP